MGDMADDWERQYGWYENDLEESEVMPEKYRKGTLTWLTKEGVEIKVSDMTDSHVLNTKRFLERTGTRTNVARVWVEILNIEIQKRGL